MDFPIPKSPVTFGRSNSYRVDFVVGPYTMVEADGSKVDVNGRTLKWSVNTETFSVGDIRRKVARQLKLGFEDIPDFWYFDKAMGEDVRLLEDEQLAVMWQQYTGERKLSLVVAVNHKVETQGKPIVIRDDSTQECPRTPSQQHAAAPATACTASQIGSSDAIFQVIGTCQTTSTEHMEQGQASQYMEQGQASNDHGGRNATCVQDEEEATNVQFDNEEEHVGVDEEEMYDLGVAITIFADVNHAEFEGTQEQQEEGLDMDDFEEAFAAQQDAEVTDHDPNVRVHQDREYPDISLGAKFPDMVSFRKLIRHYVVVSDFELSMVRTDSTRYMARCAHPGCNWRIYTTRLPDGHTIMIKRLPCAHECPSTTMRECKMASQGWIADTLTDWLKRNPGVGAKQAQAKLQDDYNVKIRHSKAWAGMKLALDKINGTYEDSFQLLFNWKAEIEARSPGSIIEIELTRSRQNHFFKRAFVAFKPYIDGFLGGCRPYIGVDSTALTGKYRGQLASATAVDGHNWLYYVAFAIFDSETGDNWKWFMQQLHKAIGSPAGLVICSDCCKGLETAVLQNFPNCEYRECIRHLYSNFMKKHHGQVYTDHLYPAARSFTESGFTHHMGKIFEVDPSAIDFLEKHHSRLWYRCAFGEASKVDYLTNNISESFNNQIKQLKGLNICELLDRIRELVMVKFSSRRQIGRKLQGVILPHVMKELNALTRSIGQHKVVWTDEHQAEISLLDLVGEERRRTVDFEMKKCSCRVWQVSGKPCKHALAFLGLRRGSTIESLVHEYCSVERFRVAYAGAIPTMPDRSLWQQVDLGFQVLPPIQHKRVAGRPRVQRIRGCLEPGRKVVHCSRCGGVGHFAKSCKNPTDSSIQAEPSSRKRKRGAAEEAPVQPEEGHVKGKGMGKTPAKTYAKTPKEKGKEKSPAKKTAPKEKGKGKSPAKSDNRREEKR